MILLAIWLSLKSIILKSGANKKKQPLNKTAL